MSGASTASMPALTRQARKAETRRALVQAAAELFAAQGMERTSLDEIAARVGLTKGAIYANFRNKEDLLEAVQLEYSQVTSADVLFDASMGIDERLAALGRELAEFMPQLHRLNVMLHLEFDLYQQRHPEKAARERRHRQPGSAAQGHRRSCRSAFQARGRLPP